MAYPATGSERTLGLVVGYLAIQPLNLLRIISLFYLLQWDEKWFELFHLYVWQALIFLDVLVVFVLWVRWLPPRQVTPPTSQENAHA